MLLPGGFVLGFILGLALGFLFSFGLLVALGLLLAPGLGVAVQGHLHPQGLAQRPVGGQLLIGRSKDIDRRQQVKRFVEGKILFGQRLALAFSRLRRW